MTVPTFQFTLPTLPQQSGSSSAAGAAATTSAASATTSPMVQSLFSNMGNLAVTTPDSASKPAISSGTTAPFSGFTMPTFKPPTTAATFTFDKLSPTGFQDINSLDIQPTEPQKHPLLGNVTLAVRTGLIGAQFIDTHVIVGGRSQPAVVAPAPPTALFGSAPGTKVSVTVTLHVVYSNEGFGAMIPLQGALCGTSEATAAKFDDAQATLTSSIRVAALSSPTTTGGTVYTVTLPHSLPSSSHSRESANLVHIMQAVVSLDCQPDIPDLGKQPLFQMPQSAPTPLGLISSLNQPLLCDASILPKDESEPIHVSRAVLACTSPYFRTMFSGNWAESASAATTPITSPYPASVVIPCLVHMYTNWAPIEPMPEAVANLLLKYNVNVKAFDRHLWSDVMDLADMWELHQLVLGANRALVDVLNADHERRSKPAGGDVGKVGGAVVWSRRAPYPFGPSKSSPRR